MVSCLEPCIPIKTQLIDALLDYQKGANGHHKRVDSLFVDLMNAQTLEELREVINIQIRIHRGDPNACDPTKGRHREPMKRAKIHFKFWRLLKEFETMLEPAPEKKSVKRFCW